MGSIKENFILHIHDLQNRICTAIENCDGLAVFKEDKWSRPGGGGGNTRVLSNGKVFEKCGVNTSVVEGEVTQAMKQQLNLEGIYFFASGISLVLHPFNPFVPAVHANFRYFELYDDRRNVTDQWFGGGADLTPYYLFEEDAVHFHGTFKKTCDLFDRNFYPAFKQQCDLYFVNKHRNNEARGIGGIFFDYLRPDDRFTISDRYEFTHACSESFLQAYIPVAEKRKSSLFTENNKYWQEIRRGRYVEFNLIHDRGTLFGLKTNGRTESILMSLPPTVRFDYDYSPAPGSPEDELYQICLHPKNWL